MGKHPLITPEQKLNVLRKAWGFVEVSQVTIQVTGRRVWLVKNYKGKPISNTDDQSLPGNPKAIRRIEYSGSSKNVTIGVAYQFTMTRRKKAPTGPRRIE